MPFEPVGIINCLLSPQKKNESKTPKDNENPKAAYMYLATLLFMYTKTVSKMQKILLYSF